MKHAKIIVWVSVVLALAAAGMSLFINAPAEGAGAFHSSLALSLIITIVQLGAALLFVLGLKGFKHRLRVAYGLICAGIAMLGFSNLQLPIVSYYDLSDSLYVQAGIIVIPYIAPALLVFFGVRLFAKLFQLKTMWMSFWFVLGLAVICAGCAAGLGSIFRPSDGKDFIASIGLTAWTAVFLLASMLIVVDVKRIAGVLYHKALGWFVAARAVVTFTGFFYVFLLIIFGDQGSLSDYGGILVPSAISSFLFLRSGYAFRLINEDQVTQVTRSTVNIIDVVTFAASQVSNPSEIDAMLDELRQVTAGLAMGERTLTLEQQESLKQVYSEIERYLVEKEPIRRLTAEEVRRKGARYFGVDYSTFVEMTVPMRNR